MRPHLFALLVLLAALVGGSHSDASQYLDEQNVTIDWYTYGARSEQFKLVRNQSVGQASGQQQQQQQQDDDEQEEKKITRAITVSGPRSWDVGRTVFTQEQLEQVSQFFYNETLGGGHTMETFAYIGAHVKLLSQAWTDLFLHRYDTYRDMKLAAGPQVDQELCLRQLEHLNERTRLNLARGLESTDLNYVRYIDTFGRVPSGLFIGNTFWVGSHDECNRLTIELPDNGTTRARYCIGSFKFRSWPKGGPLEDILVFKMGVCLPVACDSANYKNKYELILRIAEYNARQIDLNTADPLQIYCLPDEQSELRAWWKSTPTLLTVCLGGLWITLLVFATYKDELNGKRLKLEPSTTAGNRSQTVYRSLSILNNLRSLFSTQKSSLLEVAQAASGHKKMAASEQNDSDGQQSHQQQQQQQIVDFDVIEGLKVIAAIYIISGHVLMMATQLTNNGRELAATKSVIYTLSNLMPAFAVNAFFAITGILTSYLMLKQNRSHSFVTSPLKWIAFMVYRYLRIMPMYALVTLFCKHVARYTGDGPHWDYGTSSLAARRTCEQESWAWTLLFGANFKSPLKHCVPAAWYLANDFQFFMVTPIFLAALHKRPQFGKALLLVSVVASYLAGIWSILESGAPDLTPIANFMPHGFMVYVNFLHESYTRPYYRIAAYLIGLLLGHSLFEYELNKRAHLERVNEAQPQEANRSVPASPAAAPAPAPAPEWSDGLRRNGPLFFVWIVVLIIITPSVASRLPLSKTSSRILVALFMPTFHILYALAVGVYVLLSTTGHGSATMDWLLSRQLWKPLARLSLCVVLVNVEVIAQIIQSSRDTKYMNNQYFASLNVYAIIWTYLVAAMVCILFEAPVRAGLNQLLIYAVDRVASKTKKTQ